MNVLFTVDISSLLPKRLRKSGKPYARRKRCVGGIAVFHQLKCSLMIRSIQSMDAILRYEDPKFSHIEIGSGERDTGIGG
jgi:hypothetical protein